MKKTGIFYGSTTCNTEKVARLIAKKLNVSDSDIHEAATMNPDNISEYELLILGSSTWGCGELQDDWYDALDLLKKSDIKGKTIALFGTGDGESYSDTFCDALGIIYDSLKDKGADFIGQADASAYNYDDSVSVKDGKFVGLAIDEDNESSKTEKRVEDWIKEIVV